MCRRYPPQVYVDTVETYGSSSTDPYAISPMVSKDDWCGEWKEIPRQFVPKVTT